MYSESLSHFWLFATRWTAAHQTPLSMDFYFRGSSWPMDWIPVSCFAVGFFTRESPEKHLHSHYPVLYADNTVYTWNGYLAWKKVDVRQCNYIRFWYLAYTASCFQRQTRVVDQDMHFRAQLLRKHGWSLLGCVSLGLLVYHPKFASASAKVQRMIAIHIKLLVPSLWKTHMNVSSYYLKRIKMITLKCRNHF